jgi:hypothetical protein
VPAKYLAAPAAADHAGDKQKISTDRLRKAPI